MAGTDPRVQHCLHPTLTRRRHDPLQLGPLAFVRDTSRLEGQSGIKEVVNEALRRGLAAGEAPGEAAERFRVVAEARGFRPGVDPRRLNQLLDELDDSVIDDYITTMQQLLLLETDEVRPGHYQSFDRRRLRELVTLYLESKKAPLCPADV